MLWLKAFHIIFVVCWFAGLFYLPRLFVYHVESKDRVSSERFKIMERRLYYGIIWPSGILTTIFGVLIVLENPLYYLSAGWFHTKLTLVLLLWVIHLLDGHYLKAFRDDQNKRSELFFRLFNEVPVLFLIGIVILVVVKPF